MRRALLTLVLLLLALPAKAAVPAISGIWMALGDADFTSRLQAGTGLDATEIQTLQQSFVDGAIIIDDWFDIEPSDGTFDFSHLDVAVNQVLATGKKFRLAIRAGSGTPAWLLAEVATWTMINPVNAGNCASVTLPMPFDSTYLSRFGGMVSALGAHYAGNPNMPGVVVTGMNRTTAELWQPGYTGQTVNGCVTNNDVAGLQGLGWTEEKAIAAWKTMLADFAAAFPSQVITLNGCGESPSVNAYSMPPIGFGGVTDTNGTLICSQYFLPHGYASIGQRFAALNAGWQVGSFSGANNINYANAGRVNDYGLRYQAISGFQTTRLLAQDDNSCTPNCDPATTLAAMTSELETYTKAVYIESQPGNLTADLASQWTALRSWVQSNSLGPIRGTLVSNQIRGQREWGASANNAGTAYDFANLPANASFTRSGTGATDFDATGTLNEAAANVPRFGFDPASGANGLLIEESRTNSDRNPRAEGAVNGAVGSGGAWPTNWSTTTFTGLTFTISGAGGTDSGMSCATVRMNGTTGGTNGNIFFESSKQIAAVLGQSWVSSVYAKLVAGSMTNITSIKIGWQENNSSGTALVQTVGSALSIGSGPISAQRAVFAGTVANSSTAFIQPDLRFNFPSTGLAVDITLELCGPQAEAGPYATSLILPPAGTPGAQTRNADVLTLPVAAMRAGAMAMTFWPEGFDAATGVLAQLDDGTDANRIAMTATSSGDYQGTATGGTADSLTTLTALARNRTAIGWNSATVAAAANGGATITNAASPPSGAATIRFGNNVAANAPASFWLQRLRIAPRDVSAARLGAIQ